MAIVSDLPFTLNFIKEYLEPQTLCCELFYDSLKEALESKTPTVIVQENDPVSILFSCEEEAKLYLDALDIIPEEYDCKIDDRGRIYRNAEAEKFPLYMTEGNEFDVLRVDSFVIEIEVGDKHFYGWMQVVPKQLDQNEWEIMITDLEEIANGLSQDIVQRSIGLGDIPHIAIPPKLFREFLIFEKNSDKLLAALYDIAENPRFSIKTDYERFDDSRDVALDSKSIREGLKKPHYSRHILAPKKSLCFDTQENRYLKKIIRFCIERIRDFKLTVENMLHNDEITQMPYARSTQYQRIYRRNLQQYLDTSDRIGKMLNVITLKEWYATVSDFSDGRSSHAFALDPCFAYIDKIYRALKNEEFKMRLDHVYSFSWKKSSYLYEVWSFLSICRMLGKKYEFDPAQLIRESGNGYLLPELEPGKQIEFINENTRLLVSYDRRLPTNADRCSVNDDPYFYDASDSDRRVHNRPDIRIDVFYLPDNIYIGSLVIECKYRRIKNFYRNQTHNSLEQITSYYDSAQTTLYFNELALKHDIRPVVKVIVVTPDNAPLPRGRRSKHVVVRKLRPGDCESLDILENEIAELIQKQMSIAQSDFAS